MVARFCLLLGQLYTEDARDAEAEQSLLEARVTAGEGVADAGAPRVLAGQWRRAAALWAEAGEHERAAESLLHLARRGGDLELRGARLCADDL